MLLLLFNLFSFVYSISFTEITVIDTITSEEIPYYIQNSQEIFDDEKDQFDGQDNNEILTEKQFENKEDEENSSNQIFIFYLIILLLISI